MKKKTKEIVGASVMMGVGNVALGQMGQGSIGSTMTNAYSNMMPATISASYGMSIMQMANKHTKKGKSYKFKKGKHVGYGDF